MKISVSYPPLESSKGIPLLGQNRQFQWFNEPSFIYPMVPAYAASLLKEKGYDVLWDDAIAEEMSFEEWKTRLKKEQPDVVAMEAKTPIIKQYWNAVDTVKEILPNCAVVLMGDHVTAFPEESFGKCGVDYVITGGDYDFLLLSIVEKIEGKGDLDNGIYYRSGSKVENTGKFKLNHDLDSLPFIDRDLTKWELYAYHNGNYKKTPGTYMMTGRDCWWARCKFCSWTTLFPQYRHRSAQNALDEVGHLIENYGVKEIMDDSGTLPIGKWLREFCEGMIERGYHKKVTMDCNMRLSQKLSYEDMKLMKKAGFRLILVGIESANQETLDHIDKGEQIEQMLLKVREMKKAGLYPHITIMFGYPWEGEKEAKNTLETGKRLLIKNTAYTMQATVVIPYPGTPLYDECKEKDWLKFGDDWERYDMREPVMKTPMGDEKLMEYVQGLYSVSFHPGFLIRKFFSIRDMSDIRYFWRAGKKVLGHIFDFKNKNKKK